MFTHSTKHNLSTHHSIDVKINNNSMMSNSERGSMLCTFFGPQFLPIKK